MSPNRLDRRPKIRTAGGTTAALALAAMLLAGCGSSGSEANTGGASGGASSKAAGTPIKVGNIGTYSGPSGSSYSPNRDAVVAWSKAVNAAGGINGHPIELYAEDDAGDPAKSAQILRDLVENKKVVALVGVAAGNTDASWASYLATKGVPVVGGVASSTIWNTNPLYFPASAGSQIKAAVSSLVAKQQGKNNVYSMYCAELAVCAGILTPIKSSAEKLGTKFVGSAAVSASAADYASTCLQAKQTGAEVVADNLTLAASARMIPACDKQGFRPIWLLSQVGVDPSLLAQPALEGSFVYSDAFYYTSTVGAEFRTAMGKYSPQTPLTQGTASWTGAKLFQEALRNVPADGTVTAAQVLDGLNSIKNNDLGGITPQPLSFTQGQPHEPMTCIFVLQIQNREETNQKTTCSN